MRRLLFILLLSFPALATAQVLAPGADYKQPTTELVDGRTDTVYVFYDDHVMTLSACLPDGHSASFTWTKLNTETKTETGFCKLDTVFREHGVTASTYTIPKGSEGGYQVFVEHELVDLPIVIDTFSTWVFRDTFRIDTIKHEITCDRLWLEMETTPFINIQYRMYNFKLALTSGGGDVLFPGGAQVMWTPVDADGNEVDIFPGISDTCQRCHDWRESKLRFAEINAPPPLLDAMYKLKITDVFGKEDSCTTDTIKAISVYAQPVVEALEKDGNWEEAGEKPGGEALYKVRFLHNKSVSDPKYNLKYKWKGLANKNQPNGDKTLVWADSTTNADTYIYPRMPYRGQVYDGYTPGTYQVRLIVTNNVCTDSASFYLSVTPSEFAANAVPNVFTPNGDNQNDIFTFVKGNEPVSMEFIRVYIYSRSGGLVYRYEGRTDEWHGWDGRMMGSGGDVGEGVYYYVISGRGWDEIDYNSKEFSGYLHLFR